jgi:hypothetical protein
MRWSKEREEDVEWQLTGNEERIEGYSPGGTSCIHFMCTAICFLCAVVTICVFIFNFIYHLPGVLESQLTLTVLV